MLLNTKLWGYSCRHMHIHMYECIENERDKKENRLGVNLIDELNG